MKQLFLVFSLFFLPGSWSAFASEADVETVSICSVIRSPQKYSGRFISTKGRLERRLSLNREVSKDWYLGIECGGSVLVVMPREVTPHPGFAMSYASDSISLVRGRTPGFTLQAKFEGRIDWSGAGLKKGEPIPLKELFGDAKVPLRLVLRRVSEAVAKKDIVIRK